MMRLATAFAAIPRRERAAIAAAMVLGLAIVLAYVTANRFHPLVGDQPEYDMQGAFFTVGKWWWSTTPFGVAHASAWKAPLYPAWVGFWYEVLGRSATRVEYVQAFLAPLTVFVTWLLARRLFTPRVAIASAFVVAIFPFAWEFYGLLYPEALAVPLTTLILLAVLGREPSLRWAALVGALIGIALLVRPTSFFLFAGVAAAWIVAAGPRRGIALTALAIGASVLVVSPWTVRNYVVTDGGLIPISVQDAATYGTFNETAASDPELPFAWRAHVVTAEELVGPSGAPDDAELRADLQQRAFDYIAEHPASVAKAFFWNGLTRFWDIRQPKWVRLEAGLEGRSKAVTTIGLGMYYVLLPLAIAGLWRMRRRPEILVPVLALVLAASLVFTVQGGTRYRAPLEPLIVVMAASLLAPAGARRAGWTATGGGSGAARRESSGAAPRAEA